ncbi:cobalt ABC transporter permease [Corynebacterium yudongzhengii]|uniref:Energy-coupling factor transporter transmembrane protein EcfT n=1 Tax=Corynebacterium yudongzhengii TaxID=2080740 RepID=A0A2U1T5A8_9CORY|nr:energy-coupling factor transporter transmembrane protein EcfT [Corynebacterium yudongzhengii]AWB81740.1 cobalt ABC transporter permease [Corynebacterium yudongzhengii]PWC01173.1 energy-coupling factor transporter transmembrane protein EcfT [Corynebacterium yudongzhengii]
MFYGIPLGVYVPGTTPLHRLDSGIKLLGLILFILVVIFFTRGLLTVAIAAGVVTLGYVVAKIPPRTAAGQILPAVPVVALLGLFQWWQADWQVAVVLVVSLITTIAAAALLTLSTRVAEIMEAIEDALAPLQRWGVPVESISLAMSLTLRLIPLQLDTVNEALDARKARGAGLSIGAFGVPVLVRSVRRARALGEALIARGVGD